MKLDLKYVSLSLPLISLAILGAANSYTQTVSRQVHDDRDTVLSSLHLSEFPLQPLGSCEHQGISYQSNNLTIQLKKNSIQVEGKKSVSHGWSAVIPVQGLGCDIFTADLTHNGQRDLIFYVPGIGDRGAYGVTLALLLFDTAGTPTPWYAVGRFTENTKGIEEIKMDNSSSAWIVHTKQVGHPAWDGISYITSLYSIGQDGITSQSRNLSGIDFPHIASATVQDKRLRQIAERTDLTSMFSAEQVTSATLQRIPILHPASAKSAISAPHEYSNNSTNAGENMQVSPATDEDVTHGISLSNGTKLDYPNILVISEANGATKIVFKPEEEDFRALSNYHIQAIGTNCYDLDECQPFLIQAISKRP